MKPKQLYMLLLICSLGLLSSANQTSSDCKKVAPTESEESTSNCSSKSISTEDAESTKVTPLNLFLFEL